MNNPEPIGLSDEDLIRLLGETLDFAEPVPTAAVEAAYAAVDMDLLTEELAALVFDSSSTDQLVSMRATEAETRLLSFVNDHLTVDLDDFGRFRVVAPAGPIRLRATGLLITPWITR